MLGTLFIDNEETSSKKNVILQKFTQDAMDWTYVQPVSFRKEEIKPNTFTWDRKTSIDISRTYNEEIGFGEVDRD